MQALRHVQTMLLSTGAPCHELHSNDTINVNTNMHAC
jgi:hypothetical protein